MKLSDIVALLTLSVMVKGAWLAAVQPVILSIGALLSAIDLDVLDEKIEWKNFLPFINKNSKSETDYEFVEEMDELGERDDFPGMKNPDGTDKVFDKNEPPIEISAEE